MTTESSQDQLERKYMGRFSAIAAEYGVEVRYERDRAARDIGLHLFRKRKSGHEQATGSLIWFQMKGVMSSSLPGEAFAERSTIPVQVKVADVKLWARSNGPTYLVVYVESADKFLILDIVEYARRTFGDALHTMKQDTVTVHVPTSSVLDDDAFETLLQRGSVEEWSRMLDSTEDEARYCMRDFSVIWHIGTAQQRQVEQRFDVTDWQSKLRGEVDFQERPAGSEKDEDWESIRSHWQLNLTMDDVETTYSYLDFEPADEEFQADCEWSNEDGNPEFKLKDGTTVFGRNAWEEYHTFLLRGQAEQYGKPSLSARP